MGDSRFAALAKSITHMLQWDNRLRDFANSALITPRNCYHKYTASKVPPSKIITHLIPDCLLSVSMYGMRYILCVKVDGVLAHLGNYSGWLFTAEALRVLDSHDT